MYGGAAYKVRMRCSNAVADYLIDKFGKDIMLVPDGAEHFGGLFGDLGIMALIPAEEDGARFVQHHAFDGGGTDVDTDLQGVHL